MARAVASHEKVAACCMPCAENRARRPASLSIVAIAAARASASSGSTVRAASPTTSGNEEPFAVTTGVPQAKQGAGGRRRHDDFLRRHSVAPHDIPPGELGEREHGGGPAYRPWNQGPEACHLGTAEELGVVLVGKVVDADHDPRRAERR